MDLLSRAAGRAAAAALLLPALLAPPPAAAEAAEEYALKAAFLLNFTRFVEWPAGAFADADDPLRLCVLGHDPFGDTLERVLAGETVGGRPLELRRLPAPARPRTTPRTKPRTTAVTSSSCPARRTPSVSRSCRRKAGGDG